MSLENDKLTTFKLYHMFLHHCTECIKFKDKACKAKILEFNDFSWNYVCNCTFKLQGIKGIHLLKREMVLSL